MWFIFGLVLGIAGTLLFQLVRSGMVISWYEWLMGAIGVVLLYVGVWHFFASLRELESQAGWFGLAVIALPGIILLVVAWRLAWRRQRAGS